MGRKNKLLIRIMIISVIILAVAAAVFVISKIIGKKMIPSKERMSGYAYWQVYTNTDKVLVLIDNDAYPDEGIYKDGKLYLSQKFVEQKINIRFYYDKYTDTVKYTNHDNMYTYYADNNVYNDFDGNELTTEYPFYIKQDDVPMISWEWVASLTNCSYQYFENPQRVVITFNRGTIKLVDVKKDTELRYRGGIKSDILEDVKAGDSLMFIKSYDDWLEVKSESGYIGYIKTDCVTEPYDYIQEDTFVEERVLPEASEKINLAWFQTTDATTSSSIMAYHNRDSGVNVISPTWFSISSTDGEYTSQATGILTNYAQNNNLKVWALIDDFNKEVDYAELFSNSKYRKYLIHTLINEVQNQGIDGINVDFENVKQDFVADYLQFLRELSIELHKRGRILSVDNYVPMSHNAFYNIAEQSYFADYIIIMAYDEHYNGSEAGSVSSISYVENAIQDTLAMIPKEQLIVGIPFYTRIWTVKNGVTTSKAVSMQAAIDRLKEKNITPVWDEQAGQYFGSYVEDGATVSVWLEEETSIEEKMKALNKAGVAGVAEWKLGLERDEVWSIIDKYNQ